MSDEVSVFTNTVVDTKAVVNPKVAVYYNLVYMKSRLGMNMLPVHILNVQVVVGNGANAELKDLLMGKSHSLIVKGSDEHTVVSESVRIVSEFVSDIREEWESFTG